MTPEVENAALELVENNLLSVLSHFGKLKDTSFFYLIFFPFKTASFKVPILYISLREKNGSFFSNKSRKIKSPSQCSRFLKSDFFIHSRFPSSHSIRFPEKSSLV